MQSFLPFLFRFKEKFGYDIWKHMHIMTMRNLMKTAQSCFPRCRKTDRAYHQCLANLESLENTRKLMEAYPFIYGAFGLHPDEVGDLNEDVMARMLELCRMEKAVAVGEIGLDYYWDKENHEKQEYWFRRQIALAREEKLPMIIHSREAAADTLRVMKEEKSEEIGGVIHCFSYSVGDGRGIPENGILSWHWRRGDVQNAKKIKEVVQMAPMERILLETDSPYLAPVPYRGKRNSSLYLPYVVQEIPLELKGNFGRRSH